MPTEFFVVDSFTDRPFAGNPAAVIPLESLDDADWMQHVAREMSLSETSFVDAVADSDGRRRIRWFTPTTEVDLCGHATLATAHVLGGKQSFLSKSGELICSPLADAWIEMDFPSDVASEIPPPDGLSHALPDVTVLATARGVSDLLVEVESVNELDSLQPRFEALAALSGRGVIVTTRGDDRYDFFSRWFGPSVGVSEDPVTGSAHCTLGAWWSKKLGRYELLGQQRSARSGEVKVVVAEERAKIAGQAVTVSVGTLLV